jgi:peptidoglycan/LPS O-acetylase OafA/YrhL
MAISPVSAPAQALPAPAVVTSAQGVSKKSGSLVSNAPVETYWPQLDGLRTVAFVLVLMHHLGPVTPNNSPGLPLHLWTMNSLCSWGGSGVDLFFCLSGFLITFLLLGEKKSFGNISFKLFFVRRALRIWPVYYMLLFIGCVVLPACAWNHLNHALYGEFFVKQVVPMALFVGNYSLIIATKILINFNNNLGLPIIYFLLPLWSLAVEEQFYLTWPFLLKALKSPRTIYLAIAALTLLSITARGALWYISRYVWHLPYPVALYYQTTVSHLDPLMAGAAAAVTAFYFPQLLAAAKKYTPVLMLGLAGILVAISCYFPDLKYNSYYNVPVFALIALACLLLLTLTLVSPVFIRVFGSGPMAGFGRLTYAMYLVHYFAIAIADGIIARFPAVTAGHLSRWPLRFSLALVLTYAFAFVSWHLLESRFQKLRKHFSRRARQLTP